MTAQENMSLLLLLMFSQPTLINDVARVENYFGTDFEDIFIANKFHNMILLKLLAPNSK